MMDSALGTPPRPLSHTNDSGTGVLGLILASSVISSANRDAGHSSGPSSPAYSPPRTSRCASTASGADATPGGNNDASSTNRANRGGIPRGPGARSSTALDTTDTLMP